MGALCAQLDRRRSRTRRARRLPVGHGAGARCRGGGEQAGAGAARRHRHAACAHQRRRGALCAGQPQALGLSILQPGGRAGRGRRVPPERARREQGDPPGELHARPQPARDGESRPRHRLQLLGPAREGRGVRARVAQASGARSQAGGRARAQGHRRRARAARRLHRRGAELRHRAREQLGALCAAGAVFARQCADRIGRSGTRAPTARHAAAAARRAAGRAAGAHARAAAAGREQAGRGARPLSAADHAHGRRRQRLLPALGLGRRGAQRTRAGPEAGRGRRGGPRARRRRCGAREVPQRRIQDGPVLRPAVRVRARRRPLQRCRRCAPGLRAQRAQPFARAARCGARPRPREQRGRRHGRPRDPAAHAGARRARAAVPCAARPPAGLGGEPRRHRGEEHRDQARRPDRAGRDLPQLGGARPARRHRQCRQAGRRAARPAGAEAGRTPGHRAARAAALPALPGAAPERALPDRDATRCRSRRR